MRLRLLKAHFNSETFQHFLSGDPQHEELDNVTARFLGFFCTPSFFPRFNLVLQKQKNSLQPDHAALCLNFIK